VSRVEADRASSGVGGTSGINGDAGPICAYGQFICDGNVAKVCDGQGAFAQVIPCDGECKDGQGCVKCVPSMGTCDPVSKIATLCDSAGAYTATFTCDAPNTCDPDGCHGVCAPSALGTSNVGCDFWSTVTTNSVWEDHGNAWGSGLHFGVLVGNVSATDPARVDIVRADQKSVSVMLMPREVQAINLPWVQQLKGDDWKTPWQPASSTESASVANGAHHITSTRPIVAYQFSPVEGTAVFVDGCPTVPNSPSGCFSYSTDASLLLPWHALFGSSYAATGYHALHQEPFPPSMPSSKLDMGDFLSITAAQDQTTLTITLPPNQTVLPWTTRDPLVSGQALPQVMNKGDVIQLVTPGKSADESLSGTEIVSGGKPLQIFSGLGCASIPVDPGHCGHMEDAVIPKEAFGKEYVVPVLYTPPDDSPTKPVPQQPIAHTIRVQAIQDGTAITFEPSMLTGVTLNRGEVVELPNVTVDVRISSTVPFGVTQFVNGRGGAYPNGFFVGGPNQVTAVPISQFQTSYDFAASPLFTYNYVSILAPTAASVSVDDRPILSPQFTAVGSSGMSVARVPLEQSDRLHSVSADKPVGIVVYGYTRYASYAYPGGLDLTHGPATH
jgi:IgGFc binding protein